MCGILRNLEQKYSVQCCNYHSQISMTVNTASVGLLIGNIMGPYLQMETYAYICLIPNFIFLIAFSFIPESPYHYIMHNEIEKAEESLKWYRRESDVKGPCQELQDFIHSGTDVGFMAKLREFSLPGKPVKIMPSLNYTVRCKGYFYFYFLTFQQTRDAPFCSCYWTPLSTPVATSASTPTPK